MVLSSVFTGLLLSDGPWILWKKNTGARSGGSTVGPTILGNSERSPSHMRKQAAALLLPMHAP